MSGSATFGAVTLNSSSALARHTTASVQRWQVRRPGPAAAPTRRPTRSTSCAEGRRRSRPPGCHQRRPCSTPPTSTTDARAPILAERPARGSDRSRAVVRLTLTRWQRFHCGRGGGPDDHAGRGREDGAGAAGPGERRPVGAAAGGAGDRHDPGPAVGRRARGAVRGRARVLRARHAHVGAHPPPVVDDGAAARRRAPLGARAGPEPGAAHPVQDRGPAGVAGDHARGPDRRRRRGGAERLAGGGPARARGGGAGAGRGAGHAARARRAGDAAQPRPGAGRAGRGGRAGPAGRGDRVRPPGAAARARCRAACCTTRTPGSSPTSRRRSASWCLVANGREG
jgi:hypothetical protein